MWQRMLSVANYLRYSESHSLLLCVLLTRFSICIILYFSHGSVPMFFPVFKKYRPMTETILNVFLTIHSLYSTSGIYRKRFDYSGKIPNNSVVWVTLAEKGTYDGYTMINAIVDWPVYPVFVSAPQHAGDGRIFTRIWNYSNEQNDISCTFYIYFVKNDAIKNF